MNWDDVRYTLALSKSGSLARAAKVLGVDHTTVGRRVEAAEKSLGVRLFARTTTGFVLTQEGERLLEPMKSVEEAVLSVERAANSHHGGLEGSVRVTSPETFGISYLAPRLAAFGRQHPGLTIELVPGGDVLDLGRRQAEIAVRFFRSRTQSLVVRRVAEVGHALYASHEYLAARAFLGPQDLRNHRLLTTPSSQRSVEGQWLKRFTGTAKSSFVSDLTIALVGAVKASAGIAVLPRYLGDPEPGLRRLTVADEPTEPVWLTVHKDLKDAPRVRVLLDFLAATLRADQLLLLGK